MQIGLLCPPRMGQASGNAITAKRYRRIFRLMGHRVRIMDAYDGRAYDALVVLHAKKSAVGALAFHRTHPQRRLIVVLTGTDLYRDLPRSAVAQRVLAAASCIVTLQPDGIALLSPALRRKSLAIIQSAVMPKALMRQRALSWRFLVVGHLRREKDPLRAAQALGMLPRGLAIQVLQFGGSLDPGLAARARAWEVRDKRYSWKGERSPAQMRKQFSMSDVLLISSRMEGGANVVCEAIAAGLPIIASRISGNVGILGDAYPGYFSVGNTRECAAVMERFALDARFRAQLRAAIAGLRPLVKPTREQVLWRKVLA